MTRSVSEQLSMNFRLGSRFREPLLYYKRGWLVKWWLSEVLMNLTNPQDPLPVRRYALQEIAIIAVARYLDPSEAYRVFCDLEPERRRAIVDGEAQLDANGVPIYFNNSELNTPELTQDQHEEAGKLYRSLCKREGIELE